MESISSSVRTLIPAAIAVAVVAWIGPLVTRTWHTRMLFRKLQANNMPMPPHSLIFGHLLIMPALMRSVPADLEKTLYFGELMQRDFADKGVFYLDLAPFGPPFLLIMNPALATQATQSNSRLAIEKPPRLADWLLPLVGGLSLFDLPGKDWKPWRHLFNQGFGASQNLALAPMMVEETNKLRKRLRKQAHKGDLFKLDPLLHRYIMDIMGRTVLNVSLHAQEGYNALVDSMESQVAWHRTNQETDILQAFNVVRPIMQWLNARRMKRFINRELDKRFAEYQSGNRNVDSKHKAVIDLILHAYMSSASARGPVSKTSLDPEFRDFAVRQIRLFAFVGQGSTTSALVYTLHLLSTNPDTLQQVRAEHDKVLGPEPGIVAEKPHLLNQLPYTKAVIKETLRLFPAASSIRRGCAGEDLIGPDADGTRYPTAECMLWVLHPAMQRSPNYWPEPDAFRPQRWLVDPSHALYPPKGAWRPFEMGPRNCLGQDLVMVELTVALALLVREFDFRPAYEEWDKRFPKAGPRTYRGDRAYSVEAGAMRPSDGYPCYVTERERAEE